MEPYRVFDYTNSTGRSSGPMLAAIGRVLPGVALVQQQVEPYARAWRQANLAALGRPGPRWIVLGDSMSQGIGASRFDAGWVNQAHERLASGGVRYQLINLSASGSRVADVLERQLPAWRSLPDRVGPADERPDLLTLLIGSNDLIRKQYRQDLAVRFAELLSELPAGAVVANLPNPRRAALAVNELIARARAERGLVVADLTSGRRTSWKGKLAQDHFHPNDLGYAGLAALFYDAITASVAMAAKP